VVGVRHEPGLHGAVRRRLLRPAAPAARALRRGRGRRGLPRGGGHGGGASWRCTRSST
jgi:hypothetical protein